MSLLSTQAAHRQYADRPPDERYPSLDAMIAASIADKNHSTERTYNFKDLHIVATSADGRTGAYASNSEITTVRLQSPKGVAEFTNWSFGQLCRSLGAPAAYLRELPPAIAADALNHGLQSSPVGSSANLLVRANGCEPIIRACTSDSYGRAWDAELYSGIAHQITERDAAWTLPPTWTGEPAGAYRGDRDSFVVLTHGGSIVTDPSTRDSGQMYRGLLVRNSEVGACAVYIEQILYRYICGNHMLWGAVMAHSFRRRHVGSSVTRDTIREIGRVAFQWAQSSPGRDEAIIKSLIDHEVAHTREAVIDELRKMGATRDQAEQMYGRCEQTEAASPRSYWGLAQGATRIAQDSPYQDSRLQLDRLAAEILSRGARLVKV